MARMVRKQFYIEAQRDELLKQRARELGVSEAELIRRGKDKVVWVSSTESHQQEWWEEEKAYISEHRSFDVPQTGRNWTRDELYEERMDRYSA